MSTAQSVKRKRIDNNLTLIHFQNYPLSTNLGAAYLAYGLDKARIPFRLKIFGQYGFRINLGNIYRFFADSGKIIAVGCMSHMLPYVIAGLERLKRAFPDKIVILGGIGPTEVAEDIIREFPFIDFVIKGCGIEPLPQLVGMLLKGENTFHSIGGLVYRNGSGIISNNRHKTSSRAILNAVAAFHLVPGATQCRYFDLFTSAGCCYQCTFCQSPVVGGRDIVFRDIDRVIDELRLIIKMKGNKRFGFFLTDESFVVNRKRVYAFCRALRQNRLNIPWSCYGRVDRMDEGLLRTLAENGCQELLYGCESGSERVLKKIKKGFSVADMMKVVVLSKKYVKVIASFICLYPFETKEDFLETLSCIVYLETKGIRVQLHPLAPIKNSLLFQEYKKSLFLTSKVKSTFHPLINRVPVQCRRLVKRYPDIFYFYYSYRPKDFEAITRLLPEALKINYYDASRVEL
ncbi:MAG: radical SAM protein [Candidatus Omnitrophica bacterium]|nr:radical SAM protein [Candidatus Omnitrophota bacterium]